MGKSPAKMDPELIKEWTENLTQLIQQFLTTDLKPADMQGVLASLTALGSTLLEQIAPPAAIAAIAALPPEALLAIETDADWVPWELLACDPAGPLWGDRLVLVRVPLVDVPPGPVAEPAAPGQLNQALLVIGDEHRDRPRRVGQAAVRSDGGPVRSPRSCRPTGLPFPAVRPARTSCTSPAMAGARPTTSAMAGWWDASCIQRRRGRWGLRHGTVVFANACSSAAARLMLAEFQSFGRAFYLAGARPFIGTLGPVPEEEANGFAAMFYDAFALQGLSAGQALRSAREQARKRFAVPIWLFYCLYGSASATRRWR